MVHISIVWSNVRRKKVRTILTFFSIVVAFLLYGLLSSIGGAFARGTELAGENRLITTNKISLIQPLPYYYLEKVRAIDGVERVTLANWFGAYYQNERNRFSQYAIEESDYFEVYSDAMSLPESQMGAWKSDPIGVVVGHNLASKFHWKIGDRIPLISMFPQRDGSTTWEFVVRGIFEAKGKSVDSNSMFLHYNYFDRARRSGQGGIGWMIVKVKDPKHAAEVARSIDDLFTNSSAETKTSSEKDFARLFAKQFGDIGLITTLILSAVFFTMLLVAANTMSQAYRERIPEIGVLKTLGFSGSRVLALVLLEATLLALTASVVGLTLASSLLSALAGQLTGTLPGLVMTPAIWLAGGAYALLLGLSAGVGPALKALRLDIVTALRRTVQ